MCIRAKPVFFVFIAAVIAAACIAFAAPYWTAAALITRASGRSGVTGTLARWGVSKVSDRVERWTVRSGTVRVRVFQPSGGTRRSVALIGGVHRDGIDERRLMSLARELAAAGVTVVTPEIDDLTQYKLTPRATDTIEDVARAMVDSEESVGLIGVSFSGGLSLVAAGRSSVRDRLAYVMSFGGHGNLPRVLNYLCTGVEPSDSTDAFQRPRPPHDYAVGVLLHQAAELIVPAQQIAPLRQQLEMFLDASALKRDAPGRADDLFETARAAAASLPEPSRTLMKHVNDRNVAELGRLLLPHVDRLGQDPSLSPDHAPPPSAPVYLLHGVDDNVIPAAESALLARHLGPRTRVRLLLSRYLTHVDVRSRPAFADTWNMIAFWKAALSE